MSLARVTTWSAGNTLTASALNGEFNNILNNPMSLISPLTANLDLGGFKLNSLSAGTVSGPSLNFNDTTGLYRPASATLGLVAGGVEIARFETSASAVNYWDFSPSATGVAISVSPAGTDTNVPVNIDTKAAGDMTLRTPGAGNIVLKGNNTTMLTITSSTSVNMGTNKPFVPAALSGTPVQHGLYQGNVIKGWIQMNGTGTVAINGSFNVTSITDNGVGDYTITWDRDFADAFYACVGMGSDDGGVGVMVTVNETGGLAAGTSRIFVKDHGNNARDVATISVIAIGAQ